MAETFDPDAYLKETPVSAPPASFDPDAYLQPQASTPQSAAPAAEPALSLGGAALQGAKNIPKSAVEFGHSMIQPVIHPVDTATSLYHLGHGVLQYLGAPGSDDEKYVDAVGRFLKDRYGGYDAIKRTLASDPVGLAADISMALGGGGGLAARAPGIIGKVGEAAATAGRAVDPLKAVSGAAKAGTAVAKQYAGNYLTHVGDRPLGEAFQAGKAGGAPAEAFQQNLRGQVPASEVVADARRAVEAIGQEAGKTYRSGMVDISKDYHMLDFADINAAIKKHENVGQFKGVDLETPQVKSVRDQMKQIVDEWRGYAPAQYHTPEGFDALKRKLGYILEETERGSPARLVAGHIYDAVKESIVKQAPAYAKIMEGYSEAKGIIREVERELVGKPDAPVGPALRRLQSVMRNNVHTSYGERERLAELLVENGADHLMQQLAGQALSSWTPRGFGKAIGSAGLAYGIGEALLHNPMVLAKTLMVLPMMSPRLLGEAAYYAGKASPYVPGATTAKAAFQIGREEQVEHPERGPRKLPVTRFDDKGNPLQ